MRSSPRRHVLVILREHLRNSQKEFAERLGVSQPYLRDIELGKEYLSPDFAHRISLKTGVDEEWLLGNQLNIPMRPLREPIEWDGSNADEVVDDTIARAAFSADTLDKLIETAKALGCRSEDELEWLARLSKALAGRFYPKK